MTVKSPEKIQTEVAMESKSLLEQIQSADAQKFLLVVESSIIFLF